MNKLLLVLLISIPTVASCDAQSSEDGAASERGGIADGTASGPGGFVDGNSVIDLNQQERAAKAFEGAVNTTAQPQPN